MKHRLTAMLLWLVIAVSLCMTVWAGTITMTIDVTGIESSHSYSNNVNQSWLLSCPGADSITMTFHASTKLENNYDFLYLYDGSETLIGKYSGTELAGKTVTIEDDTVKIKLTSDYSNTYWGFAVTDAFGTFTSVSSDMAIDVAGVESSHNYANGSNQTWTLSCAGADSITMTFDTRTKLEARYDFLYLYNAAGEEVGKYSDTELAGKTITVAGDTVKLKLTSDGSLSYWGFKVTAAYGTFNSTGGNVGGGSSGSSGNTTSFAGGFGTKSAPYLIATKTHLNNVRNDLDAHYKMVDDIGFTASDFASGGAFYNSGKGWVSIGTTSSPFTGTFDGDGYTITGLQQNHTSSVASGGLFGVMQNASVHNLGMADGTIVATCSSYGQTSYAGSIAGTAKNSTIAACWNTGSVKASVSASQTKVYAGGIVGSAQNCTILNCYNRGTVYAGGSSYNGIDYNVYAGGIVGKIDGSDLFNSYNTGTITGSPGAIFSSSWVGGIAGYAGTTSIGTSYHAGSVNAYRGNSGSGYKGGIWGYKSSDSTDANCYYIDTCTAGVGSGSDTAVKCSAAQLEQQSTFTGFDFSQCWTMGDGASYKMPTLQVQKLMQHELVQHPICGAVCNHETTHGMMEATLWSGESIGSGNYYLGYDLQLSDRWVINGSVRLCLNGHTITFAEGTGLSVREGGSLTLCDCVGNGGIKRGPRVSNGDSSILNNYGTMTIYGGSYCLDGQGVAVCNEATLSIYGGTFGIGISNYGATTIYDVVFDMPEPDYSPYPDAISCAKGSSLTIYDGTFRAHGNAIFNKGTANVYGGTFSGIGGDRLNTYPTIENAGVLYLYDGEITSANYDGIHNDISYEYSSSGTTECVGKLYVYGGTISAPAENRAAIGNRTEVTVRGGTISGYVGIRNGSYWAGTAKDGGTCKIYSGTISGTHCGIQNSGNTSTKYNNGQVSGKQFSRGILKIEGSPSINSILLEYPEALELQYTGSDIIELKLELDDLKAGDILWKYAVQALPKVKLVTEGYVLQKVYDGITFASDACGANGDNLRWKLSSDGVLTIYGTGDMKNFGFSNEQPWYYGRTQIKVVRVVVEEGVTSIGSAAFGEMTSLTKVELPDSLTKIGNWAFEYSNYQGVLELPANLNTIGRNIFNGCSAAPSQILYDGCMHQWETVSVDTQMPAWSPIVRSNQNTDDGDFTTDVLCSVCGGVDVAGIRSIEVITHPDKQIYLEGSPLDVTGGKIKACYNDDTSEEIELTADMVSGYDSLTPGTQTLTVTHKGITTTFSVTVEAKALTDITVSTPPAKLTYIRGEEEVDVTGGMLTLKYNNGTTETIPMTAAMVSSIDHNQPGTQFIAVFYENEYDMFEISLVERTGIEITALPAQLTGLQGVPFDLSGSELTVSFSDGSTDTVELEQSMLSYDPDATGTVTVTVHYKGFINVFEMTVLPKTATSITVTAPTKTSYLEGKDLLDVTGGKVIVHYDNGTEEELDMTGEMISGFDHTVVGTQTLTVSYNGLTATFAVTVEGKSITSIGVAVLPEKLVFVEGRALDVTGGKIVLNFNNDASQEIDLTLDMVSGFDTTSVGAQELTVSYEGLTTTYAVEVVARSVQSIAVTALPTRTSYIEGKIPLDVTGGKVTLYYDNDTVEEIDLEASMVSGFDNAIVGTQALTVTYGGFVTTFDITVQERVVQNLQLTAPAQLTYLQGSALDLTGGYLTVVYVSEADYTEVIPLDGSMISGYQPQKVGVQLVTVTYEGKQATFAVRVTPKSATAILVTAPTKTSYLEGEVLLDVTGGKITVYYDNGTEEELDLTPDMVSGFDSSIIGVQTLTVSYVGWTATYDVEIIARSMESIAVTTLPARTSYFQDEPSIDVTGGKITVYYDNGTEEELDLTSDMVRGFDSAILGMQTLTVTYGEFYDTFEIDIIANPVSVEILSVSENLVQVYLNHNTSGTYYAAVYNRAGRLLAATCAAVPADAGEITIVGLRFDADSMYEVKVFLVDEQHIPVCDAAVIY